MLTCTPRSDELRNSESWRDPVASDLQRQQKWSTKQEVDGAFNQIIQPPTKANASRNARKRRAGDAPTSSKVAEPGYYTHRAKRHRPTPANSQAPSSPSHGRSRSRVWHGYDQGKPHKYTPGRQLRVKEDGMHPKTRQKHAQAMPIFPQTQVFSSNKSTAVPQSSLQPGQDGDFTPVIIPQPETRPVSRDKLVDEVHGIYATLIKAETKCVEVGNTQFANAESIPKLNNNEWQALIALHRTLLHQHLDFFLAIQHPSASPDLWRLASRYAMPARMWRHGIHSFLELLRHRLPASLEHMLTFLHLAYSNVALLYETAPAFQDTWSECLGDLGRYRMAIEKDCFRDREIWTGVSRHWYSKASDKSPVTGRLYHHLAILARSNVLQQLSYYTKSLCSLIPFPGTRESMVTLLDPAASKSPNRLAPIDAEFLMVHGLLFFGGCRERLQASMDEFIKHLDTYIEQRLDAGCYTGISLGCSLLGYGAESNVLMRAMSQKPEEIEANPGESFKQALGFTVRITETVMHRWGDNNTLPFLHTMLVFVSHMTRFPAAISHIEGMFPWKLTSKMLNFLLASFGSGYEVRSDIRPQEKDQLPRPLPEDFAMRGLIYTVNYLPNPHAWFDNDKTEECERYIELDSMTQERKNRLIILGHRIAASGRWLTWNEETRSFAVLRMYETTVKDPPEPIKADVKSDNDRSQSETLRSGSQYRLKLICVRLGMAQNDDLYLIYSSIFSCVANLEKGGGNSNVDMKIDEAIEEQTKFCRGLDGSGNLDDSSSGCVFGCTYMVMSIQLQLKGSFALAASYEAEAKAFLEKALPNSSQYAVLESTAGITINGCMEEEAWSRLERWLRNYNLWFVNRASGIEGR